jgi:hypothetical protein
MYAGFSGDRQIYVGLLKERSVHLEKCARYGSYNIETFYSFVYSFISLNGTLSLLQDSFIIIKSSQHWFSLHGFSRGIYQVEKIV